LRMRKRDMLVDGGTHHEKLRVKRISVASEVIIRHTAGTRPDPACIIPDMRSSEHNQASRTPDYTLPLMSSTLY
jgi:hypothetical protein